MVPPLVVTVRDNGRGFNPRTAGGGFGLPSMRERAALINASLTIDSRPSDGTRLTVELPFPGLESDGALS